MLKLKRKLRQIEALEERQANGEQLETNQVHTHFTFIHTHTHTHFTFISLLVACPPPNKSEKMSYIFYRGKHFFHFLTKTGLFPVYLLFNLASIKLLIYIF